MDVEYFAGVSFKAEESGRRGKMNGKEEKNIKKAAKYTRKIIDKREIIIAANGEKASVFGG